MQSPSNSSLEDYPYCSGQALLILPEAVWPGDRKIAVFLPERFENARVGSMAQRVPGKMPI
jgi:hypothetical protein